ncbi:MAG: glycosyltransferase family 2 protein, partial [Clostridia bacterium]|nr:glycosyltransferase family 2 protein [Clostridia bacterium]
MKILSFGVPCYNSEEYMKKCIDSLLVGGEDVEIIIVDDGSKDNTAAIADEYAAAYPDIIKVVHQENGGHGEAVNAGLRNATGIYYKVVDSDDWLDEDGLHKVIEVLKSFVEDKKRVDLMICNYVGSIIFFVGLPPRNVLICYATLDRMEKQCCSFI